MATTVKPNIHYKPIMYTKITTAEIILPYRFIKVDGTYADNDEQMIGVSEVEWADTDIGSFICLGSAIIETSEAVNAGDWVSAMTDGKAKVQDDVEPSAGIALSTVGAAGYIEVLLLYQSIDLLI